jgi:hypothetical protein
MSESQGARATRRRRGEKESRELYSIRCIHTWDTTSLEYNDKKGWQGSYQNEKHRNRSRVQWEARMAEALQIEKYGYSHLIDIGECDAAAVEDDQGKPVRRRLRVGRKTGKEGLVTDAVRNEWD